MGILARVFNTERRYNFFFEKANKNLTGLKSCPEVGWTLKGAQVYCDHLTEV